MWTPIATGGLAERVREAVIAIAVDLERALDGALPADCAGGALFYDYLDQLMPDRGYDASAQRLLETAAALLASTEMRIGLWGGRLNVAWVFEHLTDTSASRANARSDELALEAVSNAETPYDLISGLVGIGVYALERGEAGRKLFGEVVAELSRRAVRDGTGTKTGTKIGWHTPADHLPPWQRQLASDGLFNLGVAHGVPGIVGLLARAYTQGIASPQSLELLTGATEWLAEPLSQDAPTTYCQWIAASRTLPSIEPAPSRSAWCYGDAGVVVQLAAAAEALGDADLLQKLEPVAAKSLAPETAKEIFDAGLCHGSAGLAHIAARLGQRELSSAWLEQALDMRARGAGIGGFRVYRRDPDAPNADPWRSNASWLTGAAGTGLALIASISGDEPLWDRALLLS